VELSSVLFEVEIATESFTAGRTGERLAILVRVHVERQVVDLMKRLRTHLAQYSWFSVFSM